jgi:hypothetical protein
VWLVTCKFGLLSTQHLGFRKSSPSEYSKEQSGEDILPRHTEFGLGLLHNVQLGIELLGWHKYELRQYNMENHNYHNHYKESLVLHILDLRYISHCCFRTFQ